MKYAFKFFRNSSQIKNANEIIIEYKTKSSSLLKFIEEHSNQRIIADITGCDNPTESMDIFVAAAKLNKEFTIKMSRSQHSFATDLREENINFFFNFYCDSWDVLYHTLNSGVSDVYIVNELCFDLLNARKACNNYKVKIRTFPNVAQTSAIGELGPTETFKQFFINPYDVELYSDYIDVLEFFGDSLEKQDILYRIYKSEKWNDDLKFLILGLKTHIYGNMIAPGWAERRIGCRKKCYYDNCKICDNALDLAAAMMNKSLSFDFSKVDQEATILAEQYKKLTKEE